MDVGKGMMFSANVVDGMVHQLGGQPLAQECQGKMCPEGQAIVTSVDGGSELAKQYPYILHTVPPFYNLTDNGLLASCYTNALDQVQIIAASSSSSSSSKEMITTADSSSSIRVACPLLGAGCRGFPVEEAIEVAAKSLVEWMMEPNDIDDDDNEEETTTTIPPISLAFAIPSGEIREQLIEGIERECAKYSTTNE
jgi:O-acetyl-ADP-ribose deacetylase (regulator of RNase III)